MIQHDVHVECMFVASFSSLLGPQGPYPLKYKSGEMAGN